MFGSFILEGELTFLDPLDKEHRTGAQALTANIEMGQPSVLPKMRYVVFSCLHLAHQPGSLTDYGDMVDAGRNLARWMQDQGSTIVYPIVTAKNAVEKQQLVEMQREQGREGEVWFKPGMNYCGGKHKDDRFVRTKYLQEMTVRVVGFTETTAEGHAFGAMTIESLDGKPLGSVGTGFTRDDKFLLQERFRHSGMFNVEICCQGTTESGIPWHSRYRRIVE